MSKTQMKKAGEPITPMKIVNDLWAARVSLTLAAAVDLDIFTLIAQGNKTTADITKALGAAKRGVERLLDSLVAIGYLTKRGAQFGLTPVADTFLVRTKPSFIGPMADETRMTLPGWMHCQTWSEAASRSRL
jgi:Dimerisation domain